MTTIDTDAAQGFADTFNDGLLMNHVGPRLTCTEVEALAGMLRTGGAGHAAVRGGTAHAVEDEEGDLHYKVDDTSARVARCRRGHGQLTAGSPARLQYMLICSAAISIYWSLACLEARNDARVRSPLGNEDPA